jgi:hypothetical protein
MNRDSPVVPVTFGVLDDDIPHPFQANQRVRGDVDGDDGIDRLLQDVNIALGSPLNSSLLRAAGTNFKPAFFSRLAAVLRQTKPRAGLVSSVAHSFPASDLSGLWVTAYPFRSSQGRGRHVDLAHLRAESDRRLVSQNFPPDPRTERRGKRPFLNEIEAEVANRHVVGFWKNLSDNRYFGSIHLAVLPGESVMEGHYTHFMSDVEAGASQWKWVRIDPASISGVELSRVWLKDLDTLYDLVFDHSKHDPPLPLAAIAEGI